MNGNATPSSSMSITTLLPTLTAALETLTSSSAHLPLSASDLNFHRTMDRSFAKDLDEASSRVLKITERLLSLVDAAGPGSGSGLDKGKGKGKTGPAVRRRKIEEEEDVVDGYKRGVVGVVDGLLEDADSCLDEVNGQKKQAAFAIPEKKLAEASKKLPGPFSASGAGSSARLPAGIMNADIPKPQLHFPDPVENSLALGPWTTSLTSKPHSMVPLSFQPPLDDLEPEPQTEAPMKFASMSLEEKDALNAANKRRSKERKMRQHPYYYETRHLPYPTAMFTISDPTPIPPDSFNQTPFTFVDTPEALENLEEALLQAKEIAVDLEHHSLRSYYGFTCLIQISTREGDWVIDTLKLRKELRERKLGGVMVDPSIVKIFHGADSDIVWLQRDFDIYVVNLFDTYHATKVLHYTSHSLAHLLKRFADYDADKRYQMADWRLRPLPQEMLDYARSDTHFLIYIYDNLRNALLEMSSRPPSPSPAPAPTLASGPGPSASTAIARRNPQEAMREVLELSAETALKLYERDLYDFSEEVNAIWRTLGNKWLGRAYMDGESGAVWRALHAWRDHYAREADESVFYIMPNDMLKSLSNAAPSAIFPIARAHRNHIPRKAVEEVVALIKQTRKVYSDLESALHNKTAQAKGEGAAGHQEAGPGAAITLAPATATAAAAVGPKIVDVWKSAPATTNAKAAPLSSSPASGLFGKTLSRPAQAPAPAPPAIARSALFGSAGVTVRPPGDTAPTFEALQKSLNDKFAKYVSIPRVTMYGSSAGTQIVPAGSKAVDATSKNVLPEVESVPYVPPASRTTTAKPAPAPAPAPAPQAKKKVKSDELVQVKKKQRKAAASTSTSTTPSSSSKPNASASSSAGAINAPAPAAPAKKKKVRPAPEEIPVFDYATSTNLLDNPSSGAGGTKKKDKKEKRGQGSSTGVIIGGSDFGPAPKDKSGMRQGNKSKTFAK